MIVIELEIEMIKLSLEEIKKVQIEILDEIDECCKENNINYWLDSGTLLGAIRHKGYIPWDDDIDIGMLREDYDRFIHIFNEYEKSHKKLRFDCVEINDKCFFPYGKVFNERTVLYEAGITMAINVDVFVYDTAPSSTLACKYMYFWRDIYTSLNRRQRNMGGESPKISRRLIGRMIAPVLQCFPIGFFCKRIIKNSKRYNKKTGYIGNFTSVTKIKANRNWVSKCIKMPFEGKMYNVPNNYDEWLKEFYGDYMKLPEKDKRIPKHNIVAYLKDEM